MDNILSQFTRNVLFKSIYNVNQHSKTFCTFLKIEDICVGGKFLKICEFYLVCSVSAINHITQESGYRTWDQSSSISTDISFRSKPKSVITISLRISLFMLLASFQISSLPLSFPYKSHFPHFFVIFIIYHGARASLHCTLDIKAYRRQQKYSSGINKICPFHKVFTLKLKEFLKSHNFGFM